LCFSKVDLNSETLASKLSSASNRELLPYGPSLQNSNEKCHSLEKIPLFSMKIPYIIILDRLWHVNLSNHRWYYPYQSNKFFTLCYPHDELKQELKLESTPSQTEITITTTTTTTISKKKPFDFPWILLPFDLETIQNLYGFFFSFFRSAI
jgi:hypothetical protein